MVKVEKKLYLLHGWAVDPDNEAKWQDFREALATEGVASEFIDLPGLSSPLDEVWDLDDYVEFVKAKLAGNPSILLGHSFGGQISVRLAAQYPNLVEALILLDSSGLRPGGLKPTAKRALFYAAAKIGKLFSRSEQLRKLLYRAAGERDYLNADPILRKTMQNVISHDVSEDLQKITVPVQLIWGEKDTVTPISLAKRFSSLLDKSQLEVISEARHSPQFTHPKETAAVTVAFLKEMK